jgi:hypothetical protein
MINVGTKIRINDSYDSRHFKNKVGTIVKINEYFDNGTKNEYEVIFDIEENLGTCRYYFHDNEFKLLHNFKFVEDI